MWLVVGASGLMPRAGFAQAAPRDDTRANAAVDAGLSLTDDDAREAPAANSADAGRGLVDEAPAASRADTWLGLGLAKFAAGDDAGALADFERAITAYGAHPPPELSFNRGSCLFRLGRNLEAERVFEALADDPLSAPELAALAALNAGFSALEQQAYARARAHLDRARALDRQGALTEQGDELASELSAQAQKLADDAQARQRRGDMVGAEQALARARALTPEDATLLYETGLLEYNRGARDAAIDHLRSARAHGLDATRDRVAGTYLDVLAGGLRRWGKGLSALVAVSGGYDSNVSQSGLSDSSALLSAVTTAQGAAFARFDGELDFGMQPNDSLFMLGSYQLQQLAYTRRNLDLFNAQDHALDLQAELRLNEHWRARAGARAAMSFAGLSEFRPFSFSGRGEAALTLRHSGPFETTLLGTLQGTRALDQDYAFLSGRRLELGIDESYDRIHTRAGISLMYLDDARGTQQIAAVTSENCHDCSGTHIVPLSYYGARLTLWLSQALFSGARALVRLTSELRRYRASTYFQRLDGPMSSLLGVRTQQDLRLSAQLGARLALIGPLDLELGYRFTYAFSNIDSDLSGDHIYDYADLNFPRHEAELALSAFF